MFPQGAAHERSEARQLWHSSFRLLPDYWRLVDVMNSGNDFSATPCRSHCFPYRLQRAATRIQLSQALALTLQLTGHGIAPVDFLRSRILGIRAFYDTDAIDEKRTRDGGATMSSSISTRTDHGGRGAACTRFRTHIPGALDSLMVTSSPTIHSTGVAEPFTQWRNVSEQPG